MKEKEKQSSHLPPPGGKSGRITLRPVTKEDIPLLVSWWNNPEVMTSVGYPDGLGISAEEGVRLYKEFWSKEEPPTHFILEDSEGRPVGDATCRITHRGLGRAECSLKLCVSSALDDGVGVEALVGLLSYGFGSLGLKRMCINPSKGNRFLISIGQRCGMKVVGERRGGWEMAVSHEEWERVRNG